MSLLLINGSPRGQKGNSRFLLQAFVEGAAEGGEATLVDCARASQIEAVLDKVRDASHILIAFPLYVDSMPGNVKALFESLPVCTPPEEQALGFVVQSGFPESSQSFPLERYLKKLCRRIGYRYLGTVIRGGVELVRVPPPDAGLLARFVCWVGSWSNLGGVGHLLSKGRLHREFVQLGRRWRETGGLDPELVAELRKFQRISGFGFRLYRYVGERYYWNPQLRRNQAVDRRNDRPFT